ncbi:MAG: phosphoribosyltransferase family protein [Opitutus sp.]
MNGFFLDRTEAGQRLACRMHEYQNCPHLVVLGLPRGGMPVARAVAAALHTSMDALVVRKLGLPCAEEVAMGAIAPGGVCVLDEDLIDELDIGGDVVSSVRRVEAAELERRNLVYRDGGLPPDVAGKIVVIVDDGVATGATCEAAIVYLKRAGAAKIIVAAPVISMEAFRRLRPIADDIVAVVVPSLLRSVGEWYTRFPQMSDADVCETLHPIEKGRERSFVPA